MDTNDEINDSAVAVGERRLRREIGLWLGMLVVVNATVGTGIFKVPGKVARLTGSIEAYLLVWAAGGIIALCGALTLAELAAALPRSGGIYEYLRRAYGRTVAFLFGWTMLVLLVPSAVGSFARLAAEALTSLVGLAPDRTRESVLAVVLLGVCTLANLAGVRATTARQAVIAGAKYVGIALLALLGILFAAPHSPVAVADVPASGGTPTLIGCVTALVSVMWAYDGWADLSRVSGEVRDPGRTLPRALLFGTALVLIVYGIANAGYLRALGMTGLRLSGTGENMPAANLAVAVLGESGRTFLAALVLLSCLGCCMTTLLTAPRVFVAMSTDGLFPRAFGVVSPRTSIPTRAIAIAGVLGAGYVTSRTFEQLTGAFVVGFFPFYMLAVIAVPVLRRKEPELPRPFRVPGYPYTPALFVMAAGALLYGGLVDADRAALLAFAVAAAGLPIGWLWVRRDRDPILG